MTPPAITPRRLGSLLDTAERAAPGPVLTAALGSTLEVEDLVTGRIRTYTLVEVHEAAPTQGLLSVDSPVGRALVGRGAGQVVRAATPRGDRRLRIVALR